MNSHAVHVLMLFSIWLSAASVGIYALLAKNPRTRKQGLVGLVGSATLLSGIMSRQVFHNVGAMIILEPVGGLLLFFSSLLAIKRRYS